MPPATVIERWEGSIASGTPPFTMPKPGTAAVSAGLVVGDKILARIVSRGDEPTLASGFSVLATRTVAVSSGPTVVVTFYEKTVETSDLTAGSYALVGGDADTSYIGNIKTFTGSGGFGGFVALENFDAPGTTLAALLTPMGGHYLEYGGGGVFTGAVEVTRQDTATVVSLDSEVSPELPSLAMRAWNLAPLGTPDITDGPLFDLDFVGGSGTFGGIGIQATPAELQPDANSPTAAACPTRGTGETPLVIEGGHEDGNPTDFAIGVSGLGDEILDISLGVIIEGEWPNADNIEMRLAGPSGSFATFDSALIYSGLMDNGLGQPGTYLWFNDDLANDYFTRQVPCVGPYVGTFATAGRQSSSQFGLDEAFVGTFGSPQNGTWILRVWNWDDDDITVAGIALRICSNADPAQPLMIVV